MRKHLGGWVLFALAAAASSNCQEPTQIELWLSTDLPCAEVHGTAITVGRRSELEEAFPSTSLEVCEPGADGRQRLGTVVIVRRDESDDDRLAIKVVMAVTARSPDDCKPSDGQSRGYQGCIVSRREARYLAGRTLRVSVPMLRQCEGVECPSDSTCFDAATCMPAGVTCSDDACTVDGFADRSPNAGSAGGGSGGASGATGQGDINGQGGVPRQGVGGAGGTGGGGSGVASSGGGEG